MQQPRISTLRLSLDCDEGGTDRYAHFESGEPQDWMDVAVVDTRREADAHGITSR